MWQGARSWAAPAAGVAVVLLYALDWHIAATFTALYLLVAVARVIGRALERRVVAYRAVAPMQVAGAWEGICTSLLMLAAAQAFETRHFLIVASFFAEALVIAIAWGLPMFLLMRRNWRRSRRSGVVQPVVPPTAWFRTYLVHLPAWAAFGAWSYSIRELGGSAGLIGGMAVSLLAIASRVKRWQQLDGAVLMQDDTARFRWRRAYLAYFRAATTEPDRADGDDPGAERR